MTKTRYEGCIKNIRKHTHGSPEKPEKSPFAQGETSTFWVSAVSCFRVKFFLYGGDVKILGDLFFPEHQNPQNERLRFGNCGLPTGNSAL